MILFCFLFFIFSCLCIPLIIVCYNIVSGSDNISTFSLIIFLFNANWFKKSKQWILHCITRQFTFVWKYFCVFPSFVCLFYLRNLSEKKIGFELALNQHLIWMWNSSIFFLLRLALIRIYEFRNEFHVVRLWHSNEMLLLLQWVIDTGTNSENSWTEDALLCERNEQK